MNIKETALKKLESSKIDNRALNDVKYRIILSAAVSLLINFMYAIYNGVLGILLHSVWFITMCAYYTVLSIMRFSAVMCGHKGNTNDVAHKEYFIMRLSGILLTVLSFVLTGLVYISLSENIAKKYDSIVMITIATYTFYRITMVFVRAAKQRKNTSVLLAVIRRIGYADAAAAVLTLQRSMIASFGEKDGTFAYTMNVLTGAAVCLFIFILGIGLIIKRKEVTFYGKIKNCKGK